MTDTMFDLVETTELKMTRKPGAGRKAGPNPFLADGPNHISKLDNRPVITLTPRNGTKVSTVLNQLRSAAATIDRSVSVTLVPAGTVKESSATGFAFQLRPVIRRPRKATAATAATAPVAPVAPVAPILGTRPAARAARKNARK